MEAGTSVLTLRKGDARRTAHRGTGTRREWNRRGLVVRWCRGMRISRRINWHPFGSP